MRHGASVLISGILLCIGSAAFGAETIRIAHIDPISGPFGNVGESLGRHLQAVAGDINAKGGAWGGAKLEIINMDNKSSPQGSVLVLQQAIDDDIRYVTQANGSNIAKKKYNEDMWFNNAKTELDMLVKAMNAAQSTDPIKVAKALEGMRTQGDTGELWMRADDHQLMQPLYISTFVKTGKEVKYDVEGLGLGWKANVRIDGKDLVMPTTCKMVRP